jgi:hypothetical protein
VKMKQKKYFIMLFDALRRTFVPVCTSLLAFLALATRAAVLHVDLSRAPTTFYASTAVNGNAQFWADPVGLGGNPCIGDTNARVGPQDYQGSSNWVATSAPSTNWTCVACSADGSMLVAGVQHGWLYTSTNSGATWEPRTAAGTDWGAVASSADGTRMAAVRGDGWVFISADAGVSWTKTSAYTYSAQTYGAYAVVSSGDGKNLAALRGPVVYVLVSTNSGLDWSASAADAAVSSHPISLAGSADGKTLFASGFQTGGLYGLFRVSHSWGAFATNQDNYVVTWGLSEGTASPAYVRYGALAVSPNGNNLLAGAWNGPIFCSTDGGSTWSATSAPTNYWASIATSADGATMVVAAGGTLTNGPVYTSTDSGLTWLTNNLPITNWTSVASSADGHKLVAVAYGGPIYTWQSTPAPALTITQVSGGDLAISWVIPSIHFTLQQSTNLAPANWTVLTNLPTPNYATLQNQVILSAAPKAAFYRLISK